MVTPQTPLSPYEQLLPLPTPCFKMFLERSLNDPHPTTPLQASFTATPSPSTTPSPLKILIIHLVHPASTISMKCILVNLRGSIFKIFRKGMSRTLLEGPKNNFLATVWLENILAFWTPPKKTPKTVLRP